MTFLARFLFSIFFQGYKNIMENCVMNTKLLKEGIQKMGRFNIVSKEVGVPLLALSLKDDTKFTVFQITESLRRFGWIVPAYTLPPNAEHIAVLRIVVREDFTHSLAARLLVDIQTVLEELDELPPRLSVKSGRDKVKKDKSDGKQSKAEAKDGTSRNFWSKVKDTRCSAVC